MKLIKKMLITVIIMDLTHDELLLMQFSSFLENILANCFLEIEKVIC